jgi:hypothetical protein
MVIWLILILITFLSFSIYYFHLPILLTFILAFVKLYIIALYFMGLKNSYFLWKWVFAIFVILVLIIFWLIQQKSP